VPGSGRPAGARPAALGGHRGAHPSGGRRGPAHRASRRPPVAPGPGAAGRGLRGLAHGDGRRLGGSGRCDRPGLPDAAAPGGGTGPADDRPQGAGGGDARSAAGRARLARLIEPGTSRRPAHPPSFSPWQRSHCTPARIHNHPRTGPHSCQTVQMPSALPASLPLALVCAAAATVLAWAGTPTLDRLIGRRTAWTARGTHLVLAALGGLAAGLRGHGPGEVLALVGTAVGLALLVTADLAVHRLPDRLTLPTALWVGGCWLAGCLAGAPWAGLGRALLAGAALGVGFLLLCLLTPGGIGLGDAKLAAVLGLVLGWFGWAEVLAAVVGAFLLGGLFATGLLLARRAPRRTAVAFGPWLVAGAVLALGWAPVLVG